MASNDSGGIYCFYPFERFDDKGNGVFKIGNTEQTFQQRLGQYHTYFVGGVWELCFLKIAPKTRKRLPKDFKHILNVVETWVLENIEKKGGIVIVDKRRVYKQGQSEWVYTNLEVIEKAFTEAQANFIPQYPDFHFVLDCSDSSIVKKQIANSYKTRMKIPQKFVSEYIFNTSKKANKK